jgi:hypothetical protein
MTQDNSDNKVADIWNIQTVEQAHSIPDEYMPDENLDDATALRIILHTCQDLDAFITTNLSIPVLWLCGFSDFRLEQRLNFLKNLPNDEIVVNEINLILEEMEFRTQLGEPDVEEEI